jgi:hypothetical protein
MHNCEKKLQNSVQQHKQQLLPLWRNVINNSILILKNPLRFLQSFGALQHALSPILDDLYTVETVDFYADVFSDLFNLLSENTSIFQADHTQILETLKYLFAIQHILNKNIPQFPQQYQLFFVRFINSLIFFTHHIKETYHLEQKDFDQAVCNSNQYTQEAFSQVNQYLCHFAKEQTLEQALLIFVNNLVDWISRSNTFPTCLFCVSINPNFLLTISTILSNTNSSLVDRALRLLQSTHQLAKTQRKPFKFNRLHHIIRQFEKNIPEWPNKTSIKHNLFLYKKTIFYRLASQTTQTHVNMSVSTKSILSRMQLQADQVFRTPSRCTKTKNKRESYRFSLFSRIRHAFKKTKRHTQGKKQEDTLRQVFGR